MQNDETIDSHRIDLAVLLGERLKTDAKKGLSSKEHALRLEADGPNRISPPKTIPEWLKLLKTMTGFFSLLLLGGGILCFIGYALKKEVENLYLGIVLVAVVILTGVFTYYQEKKSDDLMDSFKSMMPNRCTVVRDGKPVEVNAEDLVAGDIVNLKAGDKVPADLRILECSDDMQVDNASLTGESEPCQTVSQLHGHESTGVAKHGFLRNASPQRELQGRCPLHGRPHVYGSDRQADHEHGQRQNTHRH